MTALVPFESQHAKGAIPQRGRPAHAAFLGLLDHLPTATTWSALERGRLLGVGGFVSDGAGRVFAWALLTDKVKPQHFIGLHRMARRQIAAVGGPVEAHIDPDFPQGMRWALLLGFKEAGTMRMPDGREFTRMTIGV